MTLTRRGNVAVNLAIGSALTAFIVAASAMAGWIEGWG